ncbi:MAG: hypothetical protein CL920_20245 [Deltaproteobacteria bacterium]|nr:hypothetical protein [Deltaproteobacteria bacterium]MBU51023.1 hypothetical protein [Deltaproteobacteria bacterium]
MFHNHKNAKNHKNHKDYNDSSPLPSTKSRSQHRCNIKTFYDTMQQMQHPPSLWAKNLQRRCFLTSGERLAILEHYIC